MPLSTSSLCNSAAQLFRHTYMFDISYLSVYFLSIFLILQGQKVWTFPCNLVAYKDSL